MAKKRQETLPAQLILIFVASNEEQTQGKENFVKYKVVSKSFKTRSVYKKKLFLFTFTH